MSSDDRALGFRTKPVDASGPVEHQRPRTDEGRELARRAAAGQVHLKETVLGVKESGGPRDVLAGGAP